MQTLVNVTKKTVLLINSHQLATSYRNVCNIFCKFQLIQISAMRFSERYFNYCNFMWLMSLRLIALQATRSNGKLMIIMRNLEPERILSDFCQRKSSFSTKKNSEVNRKYFTPVLIAAIRCLKTTLCCQTNGYSYPRD
jgi:hypothetical protein